MLQSAFHGIQGTNGMSSVNWRRRLPRRKRRRLRKQRNAMPSRNWPCFSTVKVFELKIPWNFDWDVEAQEAQQTQHFSPGWIRTDVSTKKTSSETTLNKILSDDEATRLTAQPYGRSVLFPLFFPCLRSTEESPQGAREVGQRFQDRQRGAGTADSTSCPKPWGWEGSFGGDGSGGDGRGENGWKVSLSSDVICLCHVFLFFFCFCGLEMFHVIVVVKSQHPNS